LREQEQAAANYPADSAPAGESGAQSAERVHITLISIRGVAPGLTGAMIAKDFPFVKDLHRISCKSFVIMKDGGQRRS
jgi:hypothetical protein